MKRAEIVKYLSNLNIYSITNLDLENIFNLYDKIYFNGEIRDRIYKNGYILEFILGNRETGPVSYAGFHRTDPILYYIDIAPVIVKNILSDKIDTFLLIIEDAIIHLIMMMWGYSTEAPSPKKQYEIYGPDGKLFKCLMRRFFNHEKINLKSDIKLKPKRKGVKFFTGYKYWSNSCYIDSILIILFYGKSSFWRDIIFDENSLHSLKGDKFLFANQVKKQLLHDYNSLTSGGDLKNITCSGLRKLLLKEEPKLRINNIWIKYSAGSLYSILTNIIPDFLIDIPSQIYRMVNNEYKPDSVTYSRESALTFWDYMDPLTDIEEGANYKIIRWDLIESPVLVFVNGGTPRIRKMNEIGIEEGYNYIDGNKHYFKVRKARKFDKKIMYDKYEIIGVVVLAGVLENKEGGNHYTSYFKSEGNKWYSYDDLTSYIEEIDDVPSFVWLEKDGIMPSIYFYKKINGEQKLGRQKSEGQKSILKKSINIYNPHEINYKSALPGMKPKSSPVIIQSKDVEYKRVDKEDNITIFSLKSNVKKKLDKFLDLLPLSNYVSRTNVQNNTITWRVPTSLMNNLEKKIKSLF